MKVHQKSAWSHLSKWNININKAASLFTLHRLWSLSVWQPLTHWGRVTHICVSKLTIIGSDNGLPPDWRQAIIWTNAGLLFFEPLGTNFSEILIEILTFSFKKMHLNVSSAKRRPFCLGLNVLISPGTLWEWPTDLSVPVYIMQELTIFSPMDITWGQWARAWAFK